MEIVNLWFDKDKIFIKDSSSKEFFQSLLYYPTLLQASEEQRNNYKIGKFGIHWPDLDEDVSFESFEYENPEPTGLQKVLLSLPEINLSEFARHIGLSQPLISAYKNGFKKPSAKREKEIIQALHALGEKLIAI